MFRDITEHKLLQRQLEIGDRLASLDDLVMPEMTGIAFCEELLKTRPEDARRVVFLSGGAATAKVADFLASVPNLKIDEPFDVPGLRKTVLQLLATSH